MFLKHIGREFWDVVTEGGGGGGGNEGPADLGAVISESISGLEGAEPQAQAEPEPQTDEEKELAAIEQQIRQQNPNMRGQIQIHRHQAVLTRTRNAHEKAIQEWAAKEKAWQEEKAKHEAALKQYEWANDPDIQAGLYALQLSEQDQRKFAELLLSDPRYAEILQFKEAQAQNLPKDRPRPNARSEDGKYEYYDDKGLEDLLGWHGRTVSEQLKKELTEALTQQFEEKYGPVAQEFEARNLWNSAVQEQRSVLEGYRNELEGFKENEGAIKKLIVENLEARERDPRVPLLSAKEAWMQVVFPQLKAKASENEAAIRQRVLKELEDKKAAAGGAVRQATSRGVERSVESGDRDLADVIRASLPRE